MPSPLRRPSRAARARERRPTPTPWPLIAGGVAAALLVAGGLAYLLGKPSGGPGSTSRQRLPSRPSRPRIEVSYSDREVARWADQLDAHEVRTRTAAARALAAMGPRAKEAVPALLEAMCRPASEVELDVAVGQALRAIGAAGVPALLAALKSADAVTRACAARALEKLGPQAEGAVQGLVAVLERDADYDVRAGAASALGAVGPSASAALPALRKAVGERSAKLTDNPAQSKLRVRAQMAIDQIKAAP